MQLDNPAGGSSMDSMVVPPTPAVFATISKLEGAMTQPSLSTTRLEEGDGVGMPRGYRDTGPDLRCFGVAAPSCARDSVRALRSSLENPDSEISGKGIGDGPNGLEGKVPVICSVFHGFLLSSVSVIGRRGGTVALRAEARDYEELPDFKRQSACPSRFMGSCVKWALTNGHWRREDMSIRAGSLVQQMMDTYSAVSQQLI